MIVWVTKKVAIYRQESRLRWIWIT